MTLAAAPLVVPFSIRVRTASGEQEISRLEGWELLQSEEPWNGPGKQVRLLAIWRGSGPVQAGLVVRRNISGSAERVLLPGLFYGDNGSGSPSTRYPRLGPLDPSAFTSPAWDFVSERSPLPAVFAWTEERIEWLAVEPNGTGIGFSLVEGDAHL